MVALHGKWQKPQKVVSAPAALWERWFSLWYLCRHNDKADLPRGRALARQRHTAVAAVLLARKDPEACGARRTCHVGGTCRGPPPRCRGCGRGITMGQNPPRAPHSSRLL